MVDINLLKDRSSVYEAPKKKKDGSFGVELTKPAKEKDEVKKKIKQGGVLEFFKSLFKREPKILTQQISKPKEEIIKKEEPQKIETPIKEEKKTSPLEKLFHPSLRKRQEKKIEQPPASRISSPASHLPSPASNIQPPTSQKSSPLSGIPPRKSEKFQETKGLPEEKIESLGVNLIPEDVLVKLDPKTKLAQLGVTLGIIILVVGAIYGYMLYQHSQITGKIEEMLGDISATEQEISNFEPLRQEAVSLKKNIDSVTLVLNTHIYWSQFLRLLEQYTLPNVYYSNLAGNVAGKITLTAKAPDLRTLSNQYLIFQNASDFVESVTIDSAVTGAKETGEETVDFSISLTIKPEIFYKRM